ncbi:hypothetical protein QE152_g36063 [Popillia japonica]|uniref:Gustatory receptor n=1 Tax=Popillia japonica TaxID=7064 RepID=A0AAW1IDT2_POPJA
MPEVTFLTRIKPVLYLAKFFGVIHFKLITTQRNILENLIEFIYPLPILFGLLELGYTTWITSFSIRFLNINNVTIKTIFIYYLGTVCDLMLRYTTYFTYRMDLKAFLIEVDNLGKSLGSYNLKPDLRKELIIFAIISITTLTSDMLAILNSSMLAVIEVQFYYNLHVLSVLMEIFITRTIFAEIHKMFLHINEGFKNVIDCGSNDLMALRQNCFVHNVLARMLLDGNNLFNTTVIGVLLALFILLTNSLHAWVSAIQILFGGGRIDPILTSWYCSCNFCAILLIWYVIKMRMNLQNEVSPNCILRPFRKTV